MNLEPTRKVDPKTNDVDLPHCMYNSFCGRCLCTQVLKIDASSKAYLRCTKCFVLSTCWIARYTKHSAVEATNRRTSIARLHI
jgi:hypothetical protein